MITDLLCIFKLLINIGQLLLNSFLIAKKKRIYLGYCRFIRRRMAMNKRNSTLPLVCLICGDVACGINFNVRSCGSCKIFFRRHKTSPQVRKQIDFH